MYIETGRHDDAEKLMRKLLLYKPESVNDFFRFMLVADFAHSHGISNENIALAARVHKAFSASREKDILRKLLANRTIALVGNSDYVLGKGCGPEIDSHDLVIRFNKYTLEDYRDDLGSRADIWVKSGGYEFTRPDNFKLVIWEPDFAHCCIWDPDIKTFAKQIILPPPLYSLDNSNHVSLRDASGLHHPSSGLCMIWELLRVLGDFKNVDFYGFNFLYESPPDDYAHFYDEFSLSRSENIAKMKFHFPLAEAQFAKKLILENGGRLP